MYFEEIRELKIRKEDFIKILNDLIHWDEQFPSKSKYYQENLKIKKLLLELPPKKLKITLLKLDSMIYYVVVQYKSLTGEISTSWIHEDDIYRERLLHFNKEHISHKTICLTDLYEIAEPLQNPYNQKIA
ncbi:MAG: hypothetical protein KatS3mg129_1658 [Leptospiraceae bacterium]|nr:MAG: hypothetical protein KatS3mg129_1658 [Leptospiraceae bacterium]